MKTSRSSNLEPLDPAQFVRVPVLGQVFAGKPVPLDLLDIESWREIRPLKNAGPFDVVAAATVCGDSLKDDAILNGDWLIFIMTNRANTGELVIALTPDGRTVKYLWPQDDGTVLLKCANSEYEDQRWLYEDVHIQAVVKRIERDL
jgi:repressor LexA